MLTATSRPASEPGMSDSTSQQSEHESAPPDPLSGLYPRVRTAEPTAIPLQEPPCPIASPAA